VSEYLQTLAEEVGYDATGENGLVLARLTEYVAGQLGVGTEVKPRKAKLTWEKVDEMRARWAAGEKMAPLAEEFGVTYSTVSRVVTNKMWTRTELANV
jgi:hypothetical protein